MPPEGVSGGADSPSGSMTEEPTGGFRGRVMGTQAQPEGRAVTVDSFGGFLGVGYLFSHDKSTGSDVERTEHILQEKVGLGAAGAEHCCGACALERGLNPGSGSECREMVRQERRRIGWR